MLPLNTNSTSSPLASGATYTGDWYDATKEKYSNVIAVAFADQNGILYIDFSIDGVTIDETHSFAVRSNTASKEVLTLSARFFRVRFTNTAGSAQTVFRLQSSLSNSDIYQDRNYTTRLDEASASVTYVGMASVGTSESAALWQIKKISISGNVTSVVWADGNDSFDNVWSDRASLSYS